MKKTVTKSTTVDNLLGFIWAVFILTGCTYLVFWKDASAWWYLLAVLLLSVSVYHEKEVVED